MASIRRSFFARPKTKSTPFSSHQAISASPAKPESARSTRRVFGHRVRMSSTMELVALARGFLDDPRWVWHAAKALKVEATYPPQYARDREL